MNKLEDHARQVTSSIFGSAVLRSKEFNSTNKTFKIEFTDQSPKIVKYKTFHWHENNTFFGGVKTQSKLSSHTDLIADVYTLEQTDPLGSINYPFYVADYLEGKTLEVFHTGDYDKNARLEIANATGEALAKIHNISLNNTLTFPFGNIRWDGEYIDEFDSWVEAITELAMSRYESIDEEVSPVKLTTAGELMSLATNIEKDDSRTFTVQTTDFRPGNLVFNNLRRNITATGTFDWDRSHYGHWMYGLAVGEFFLTNTSQSPDEVRDSYREGYFSTVDHSLELDLDLYRSYLATQYLQQCRSFEFWYQDENESWKRSQRNKLRESVEALLEGDLL